MSYPPDRDLPSGGPRSTTFGTQGQPVLTGSTEPSRVSSRRLVVAVVSAVILGGLAGGGVGYQVASNISQDDRAGISGQLPPPARSQPPAGSVAAIVEAVRPSVVGITTESLQRGFFFQPVPARGAGSGVVLDDQGHILTNSHVVAGASKIDVSLSGGRSRPAKVVGQDIATDLAVLKVEATDLKPARFADSNQLEVGDRVIAVGNALGLGGGPTVTEGIVSALDRAIAEPNGAVLENLIQTDAAINPGNSGGPLTDASGAVVGVNTAIAGEAQNIGFAIAITPARGVVDELIRNGKIVRPMLGVRLRDVTPALAEQKGLTVKQGALVDQVQVGSPADESGIEPDDVIVEVDGKPVKDASSAQRAIGAHKPGESIELVIVRDDRRLRLRAVLAER